MKSEREKPRCWKTPVSRYWANITSEGVRAEAEPTAMPSSPAETFHNCPLALLSSKGGFDKFTM